MKDKIIFGTILILAVTVSKSYSQEFVFTASGSNVVSSVPCTNDTAYQTPGKWARQKM